MFGYFVRSNKKENIQQNMQMQNEIIIFFSNCSNYNSVLGSFGPQNYVEAVNYNSFLYNRTSITV